jgi:putative ABC transport system permease protein
MTFLDVLILALNNLRQTKIRTFLTTLGVVIGIAALTSMVSFGTGLEKNVTDVFAANDLFTSMTITSGRINFGNGNSEEMQDTLGKKIPLNDSVIEVVKKFPEVEIIYPQLSIPTRIKLGNDSITTTAEGMPSKMGNFKPYDKLMAGTFFSNDSGNVIIITTELLRKLNIILYEKGDTTIKQIVLKNKKKRYLPIDSVLGKKITLSTISLNGINPLAMFGMGGGMQSNNNNAPSLNELKYEYKICGIIKTEGFGKQALGGHLIIPIKNAQKIPSIGFSNVLDFLSRGGAKGSKYSSVYVRVKDLKQTDIVKKRIEEMKLSVFCFSDQLKEIKKGFIIIQSVLGVIGIISLFVAGLGIINTMLMSILERTREIGIMKAIGGTEFQIRSIFFFEAATIGFFGGLGGIGLGWLITRVANFFVNAQVTSSGNSPVNLFHFPFWLLIGSLIFSVLISLIAGLYPAARASKIDPVAALRHN